VNPSLYSTVTTPASGLRTVHAHISTPPQRHSTWATLRNLALGTQTAHAHVMVQRADAAVRAMGMPTSITIRMIEMHLRPKVMLAHARLTLPQPQYHLHHGCRHAHA